MDEGAGYIFEGAAAPLSRYTELAHGGCRLAESTQARIDQAIRDIVMGAERAYGFSTSTARCWSAGRAAAGAGNARTKAISVN
jgi:hypothetical protein